MMCCIAVLDFYVIPMLALQQFCLKSGVNARTTGPRRGQCRVILNSNGRVRAPVLNSNVLQQNAVYGMKISEKSFWSNFFL